MKKKYSVSQMKKNLWAYNREIGGKLKLYDFCSHSFIYVPILVMNEPAEIDGVPVDWDKWNKGRITVVGEYLQLDCKICDGFGGNWRYNFSTNPLNTTQVHTDCPNCKGRGRSSFVVKPVF